MSKPTVAQLIEKLQTHPFFSDLTPQYLNLLAEGARWREYQAGEIVILEGEAMAGLYFMQYGWLKIVKISQGGREQVLKFMQEGETFNEIGVFANRPNPATAIALEPVGVWCIRKESIEKLLRDYPEFANQVVAQMADRLLYLVTLVNDLSLKPVIGRLASLLLQGATDGVLERPRWLTQVELAARLGTVPDVVQRALRQLAKQGLIRVDRRTIYIIDKAGLREFSGQ